MNRTLRDERDRRSEGTASTGFLSGMFQRKTTPKRRADKALFHEMLAQYDVIRNRLQVLEGAYAHLASQVDHTNSPAATTTTTTTVVSPSRRAKQIGYLEGQKWQSRRVYQDQISAVEDDLDHEHVAMASSRHRSAAYNASGDAPKPKKVTQPLWKSMWRKLTLRPPDNKRKQPSTSTTSQFETRTDDVTRDGSSDAPVKRSLVAQKAISDSTGFLAVTIEADHPDQNNAETCSDEAAGDLGAVSSQPADDCPAQRRTTEVEVIVEKARVGDQLDGQLDRPHGPRDAAVQAEETRDAESVPTLTPAPVSIEDDIVVVLDRSASKRPNEESLSSASSSSLRSRLSPSPSASSLSSSSSSTSSSSQEQALVDTVSRPDVLVASSQSIVAKSEAAAAATELVDLSETEPEPELSFRSTSDNNDDGVCYAEPADTPSKEHLESEFELDHQAPPSSRRSCDTMSRTSSEELRPLTSRMSSDELCPVMSRMSSDELCPVMSRTSSDELRPGATTSDLLMTPLSESSSSSRRPERTRRSAVCSMCNSRSEPNSSDSNVQELR